MAAALGRTGGRVPAAVKDRGGEVAIISSMGLAKRGT